MKRNADIGLFTNPSRLDDAIDCGDLSDTEKTSFSMTTDASLIDFLKKNLKPLKLMMGPGLMRQQMRMMESLAAIYFRSQVHSEDDQRLVERRSWHHKNRWSYLRSPSIAFAVSAYVQETLAGDAFTAMGLAHALEKVGWSSMALPERPYNQWYAQVAAPHLCVVMRHDYRLNRLQPSPETITIAWIRNRVDQWLSRPWLNRYDMVLCSSHGALREVNRRRPSKTQYRGILRLAADPDQFYPTTVASRFETDVCFVGNFYHVRRDIERQLTIPENWRFRVWGKIEYPSHPFAAYQAGTIAYDEVNQAYNGAKIVLEDCTPMCRPWGCINSRTFEAMLTGACVISNSVPELRTLFPHELLVYHDTRELTRLIDRYLADDDRRKRIGGRARQAILKAHTYDHRAAELQWHLQQYLG